MKLLIVDDDKNIQRFYKEELEEEGYEVIIANTGKDALELFEKENPDIDDYQVSEVLKRLVKQKDYSNYADSTGEIRVCFIASNHTTGGNSGSPIFNARGELIGLNFDRCWEGTMSDIMYDPKVCRNITVDIRYVLFIVDKYANAQPLLKEMNIIE